MVCHVLAFISKFSLYFLFQCLYLKVTCQCQRSTVFKARIKWHSAILVSGITGICDCPCSRGLISLQQFILIVEYFLVYLHVFYFFFFFWRVIVIFTVLKSEVSNTWIFYLGKSSQGHRLPMLPISNHHWKLRMYPCGTHIVAYIYPIWGPPRYAAWLSCSLFSRSSYKCRKFVVFQGFRSMLTSTPICSLSVNFF